MGSQDILKQYNAVKNQYDAVNYDAILKAQQEKDVANMNADINTFSSGYDKQIKNTQAVYDKKIADEKIAYDSEYQKNAVQKLINEKKIAETNANLGLTDSGLNRTQQTAAQLSYANQKGKIDLARQSALDNLTLAMTDAITTLQNEKASGIRDIENNWKSYSEKQAQNTYNTQLSSYAGQLSDLGNQYVDAVKAEADAAADVQKAAIKASAKAVEDENSMLIYDWKGETVLDDNGNELLKFTGSDGKTYNVTPGKNPYRNTINAKISEVVNGKCIIDKDWQERNKDSNNAVTRSCALYGVFSNGYQPKGVCYYDKKGNFVDAGKLTPTLRKDYMNGKLQTVWETKDTGQYWIWNGSTNEYELYSE